MKRIKNRRGFTLIEIVVVLVILGVMAGLATPVYNASVEQSRVNEARVNLAAIHMGQRIFALNNGGVFWDPPGTGDPGVALINTTLNLDLTAPVFYPITSFTNPTPTTFTVTVTRAGGAETHNITEAGVFT